MRNGCKDSLISEESKILPEIICRGSRICNGSQKKKTRLHGQAVKTSPFHGGNTGSIPVGVICDADMAQLAEQLICNQQVNGSSPFIGLCHLGVYPTRVHGPLAQLVRATGS